MEVVASVILIAGVMMFLVSLPLMYRKIPRNSLYGIRIAESFKSEDRWYEINAYGGKLIAQWSWLVVATGAAGFVVPEKYGVAYALASVPMVLLAVLVPVVRILNR